MKTRLLTTIPTILAFSFLLFVTPLHAEPEPYIGFSAGQITYHETGDLGGGPYEYEVTYGSFESRYGIQLDRVIGVELRYGLSGDDRDDLDGTTTESTVRYYFGGLGKVTLPFKSPVKPYALAGITMGQLEVCRLSCETHNWNDFAYGGGVDFRAGKAPVSVFFEFLRMTDETRDVTGAEDSELDSLQIGMKIWFR